MFDVDRYLKALDHSGPVRADRETLRSLHKKHLIAVPYDSSRNTGNGTSLWEGVDIDPDATFDSLIVGGRGGVCYELNGLFRVLLDRIGFETGVLAAGIRQMDGSFGPDLEHVFGYVRLDGELLLVDVGFVGPSYLEPLSVTDRIQHQYGSDFRVVRTDGYHVVQRKGRTGDWQAVYRFTPQAREFAEWQNPTPDLVAFARQLAGAGTVVRGRAFDSGQKILIGRRLLTVDDGRETIRGLVAQADLDRVAADILRTDG
ncbi:arylamine N-acetyltransferase family protein [Streptomyces hokutonensis]|uniref:arylamine N-acetyltransferase family protein n=1 Tax=Streptomyces hokutonensis TaxID=1306990 RepID=UPI0003773A5B|nr:arylamine N-acetyltransferase [Streptomyces hokutonensis]